MFTGETTGLQQRVPDARRGPSTKDTLTCLNAAQNVDPGRSKGSRIRKSLVEDRVDGALLLVEPEEIIATIGGDRC